MGLFERNNDEEPSKEVRIQASDDDKKDGKLKEEAEEKLTDNSDSGSTSSSGGSLPGIGGSSSTSSTGSSSNEMDLDDIHSQNERIIELLNDIKSEISSGGGNNQLL